MLNDMFLTCSKTCFENFTTTNLNANERKCVEYCQKKYYLTYQTGSFLLGRESESEDRVKTPEIQINRV